MTQPTPWFRKFNSTWYVQIGNKQIPLAKGKSSKDEAFECFYQLMAQQDLNSPEIDQEKINLASLCDVFLDWSKKHQAKSNYEGYRHYLQSCCDQCGTITIVKLKPFHITRWLDSKEWSQSTVRTAITAVKRVLNWAIDEGYIDKSPLNRLKRPPCEHRQRLVTDEEHRLLLNQADKVYQAVLTALKETGARPGEIAQVIAADVSIEKGIWILKKHKTMDKTGKPRIIFLNKTMREVTERLIKENPTGAIFRNGNGTTWTTNSIRLRFNRLKKKLNLSNDLVPYSYRHTFITQGMVNGLTDATMAELVGHSDTKMINQHYGHLNQHLDYLQNAVERATQS